MDVVKFQRISQLWMDQLMHERHCVLPYLKKKKLTITIKFNFKSLPTKSNRTKAIDIVLFQERNTFNVARSNHI